MTTVNVRVVALEGTSSGRRCLCQYDDGLSQTTRPTFSIEVPFWMQSTLKVGDLLTVSLQPSRVEAVGGGAAGSPITVYTFAPGGSADPTNRIYTTWAALMTAHNADTGLRAIYFDDTAGTITIPTGSQAFGGRTSLQPKPGRPTPMVITLTAGTVLAQPAYLSPLLNLQA